jgi:predicted nucleic acid-binding protein
MKAVIDTNIVLDALASRMPFDVNAKEIFRLAAKFRFDGAITASSATDIYYLVRKYLQSPDKAAQELKKLYGMIDIISVNKAECTAAFDTGIKDYEDSLLSVCALRWGADFIITRNTIDFTNSLVKPIQPADFLKKIEQITTP